GARGAASVRLRRRRRAGSRAPCLATRCPRRDQVLLRSRTRREQRLDRAERIVLVRPRRLLDGVDRAPEVLLVLLVDGLEAIEALIVQPRTDQHGIVQRSVEVACERAGPELRDVLAPPLILRGLVELAPSHEHGV